MSLNHKSPDPRTTNFQETVHVSPAHNLRHVNSSEGPRTKSDLNKLSGRNFLLSEQSINEGGNLVLEGGRHYSAQAQPKYRITTSTGHLKSAGQRSNKGQAQNQEGRHLETLGVVQNIRNINSAYEKDSCKPKYFAIDKEKLHEETLQLKRLVNNLQEENTKLRTRNTHLEKEACKFEKMFQEASLNPKKQKQLMKAEEGNIPSLKQHIRELKTELEDKEAELYSLKKKSKVTKVHELEVQLQAFQEETLRLRAFADNIIAKKTDKIIQEGERHLVQIQNAECTRLRKELELLQVQIKNYEMRNQDYQNQLANKEEKIKRDKEQSNRTIQAKERELIKLKSQLAGLTAAPTATPSGGTNKKSSANVSAEGQIRKELEKMALENHDLKVNLEEKNDHISQLERRLREIGARSESKHAPSSKEFLISKPDQEPSKPVEYKNLSQAMPEEEVKKVITSPSYQPQAVKEEELKKNGLPPPMENKPIGQPPPLPSMGSKEKKSEQPQPPVPIEKKISQDDAKKIGYHINLSFRDRNVPFEAIEGLDWDKYAQNGSLSQQQLVKILESKVFGLSEKEISVLAQYLLQECQAKEGKTVDADGLKDILTGLIGPLPYWDEEMRKKLHNSIYKLCSEYRETLAEAFELTCTGKYLTRKDLEEATKTIDITLNFAQLEYIITKLYERSHDAHKLSIDDFFELFCVDHQKEEKIEEKPEKAAQKSKNAEHGGLWTKIEQKREEPKKNANKENEAKPLDSPKTKSKEAQDEVELHENVQHRKKSPKLEETKPRKGSQNSRKSSEGKILDNADEIYRAGSGEEEEKDEIYNDDGEDEEEQRKKLSDEEDQDDEKYEYLFPAEEEKNERITERGEDEEEEEEEEYKDDAEEENQLEKERQHHKKEAVASQKRGNTEEDEYQDDAYEEEAEEEEKIKSKSKEFARKSSEREEVQKFSQPSNSDRSNQKILQKTSPREVSKESRKVEDRRASGHSENSQNQQKKSEKIGDSKEVKKGKENKNKKVEAFDDNYEEEFEAEFPEDES